MRQLTLLLLPLLLAACGGGGDGELRIRASGGAEARDRGIAPTATADGWEVVWDHAVIQLEGVVLETSLGEQANLELDPSVVELIPNDSEIFVFEGVPAQRWDRFSYLMRPVTADTRNVNVDEAIVARMEAEGWSNYYSGTFLPPDGTLDEDGEAVGPIDFELGFPVEADYRLCIAGTDRTDGVVVPLNSTGVYEVTWHLTHLFFDSFLEDSALRVEALATQRDPTLDLVTTDDLDVTLGSLRAIDGGLLLDGLGNPVQYNPPSAGADTLREFVLNARFGHFSGLEGFCTTEIRILE